MAREMYELNMVINHCVLNTLMTIKLCGENDGFDELAMVKCVSSRIDQITQDACNLEQLSDFDIDYYIDSYIELMSSYNTYTESVNMEDDNNDQKDV